MPGYPFNAPPVSPTGSPPHTPSVHSPLSPFAAKPLSPLGAHGRAHVFPTSQPLRPFASLAHPTPSHRRGAAPKPAPLIIEPPAGFSGTFVLNLTQAEFSRQD